VASKVRKLELRAARLDTPTEAEKRCWFLFEASRRAERSGY